MENIELMNNDYVPAQEEQTLKVLIAVESSVDDKKYAVDKETYIENKADYTVNGIAFIDETKKIYEIMSLDVRELIFSENGKPTIPDSDESVVDVVNPTVNEYNGKFLTDLHIMFAKDGEYDSPNCAIGYCKSYKDGSWWLGNIAEVELIRNNIESVSELISVINSNILATYTEGMYWTSNNWSDYYTWSIDFSDDKMRYWKSRTEAMNVVPFNSAKGYEIIEKENEEIENTEENGNVEE